MINVFNNSFVVEITLALHHTYVNEGQGSHCYVMHRHGNYPC